VKKRVLVIEFNQRDAQAIATTLERKGYAPLLAPTGAMGLDYFFGESPDMVFVNLLMPDVQGTEIIQRIRSRVEGENLPIIAINQISGGSNRLMRQVGATDQINKPIDINQIQQLAERFLGSPESPSRRPRPEKKRPASKRPSAKKKEDIPAKGLLQRFPLHQLLARIFRNEADGSLQLEDELGKVIVSFRQGVPIHVEADGFSRRLARDGKISDREAQTIRRRAAAEGISPQKATADLQLLDPDTLTDAIRGFSYSVLRDLCRPNKARFRWSETIEHEGQPLDPAVVVELAAKRHFPPEKIAGALENKGRITKPVFLAVDPQRLPDRQRRPQIEAVVEAARRAQPLRDLFQTSEIPREDLMRAAYALGVLHAITFEPDEAWSPPVKQDAPKPEPAEHAPKPEPVKPTPKPEPARPAPQLEPAKSEPEPALQPPETPPPAPDDDGELSDEHLLRLGRKLLKDKTYSKAQQCFNELLERNGDEAQVLLLYGIAAYRNRFVDTYERLLDAVDSIRRAIALDPKLPDAHYELARILADTGHTDLSKQELQAQLAIVPDHSSAQQALRRLERRERR